MQATEEILAQAEEQQRAAGGPAGTAAAAAAAGFSTVKVEDPDLARTSPSVLALAQQIDLISFAAAIAQVSRGRPEFQP